MANFIVMKMLYTFFIVLVSLQVNAAAPTLPASNLYFAQVDGGYFNIGWTPGNGAKRIIVCKAGSPVSFVPQNGIDYTANTAFGSGQQPVTGEFVVYNSAFTSFYLTGLSPATQYYFAVFEYNGTGAGTEYLTSSYLTANAATSAAPSLQVSNAVFSNITTNSVNINWTSGNGLRRMLVAREGAPVNAEPANSQPYAGNSIFGSGASIGSGNYSVYSSTGTSTTVTNLKQGTQYFFSFYEYNGSGQPQYLLPAYTSSIVTRSVPTVPASGLVITKTDGKALTLGWINGNGQRRIVMARKGSAVTSLPVDGVAYTANAVFGSGSQLAADEFVVYNDNFNAATVTGLDPASNYYFRVFEYDGTGSNTAYLSASFASVNGNTASTPASQASGLMVSNAAATSLNLAFTAGSGRARLLVARKNAVVNALPQDFTVYTASTDFGNGQDLGNGNFVVGSTTDAFAAVQNLQPNTSYHFAVFEFNGFNQPLYLAPAAVFSAATLAALPVKLVEWKATVVNTAVHLQWTSSTEINSSFFDVERSADGIHFISIARVPAAGSSNGDIAYSREDVNPLPGKSFYRLKMVDKDGHTEYTAVLTVNNSSKMAARIARNPVQGQLQIVNVPAANANQPWQIVSAAGQPVKRGRLQTGTLQVDVAALPAGTYWLQLYNGQQHAQVLPFVKQ